MPHPLVNPAGAWMRDTISDEEVASRVLEGEPELFELIVRRHNQRLFRVVRALVGDDDEAEEALQIAYVDAWRALDRFEGRARLTTWMTRIAIRAARRVTARRRRAHELAEDVAARTDVGDLRSPAPYEELDAEEARALLESVLDRLPESQRVVFVLRALEGESVEEVARALGIGESNVKVRMHRARKALAARLQDRAREVGVWSFAGDRCDRITRRVMVRVLAPPA